LHARLWESATTEYWSLLVARLYRRKFPNFGIWLPDFENFCRNLTMSLDSSQTMQDSGETGLNLVHRNPAMAARHHRIPFYSVSDFFVRTKCQKIFSRKPFFKKKWFLWKYFMTKKIFRQNKHSINWCFNTFLVSVLILYSFHFFLRLGLGYRRRERYMYAVLITKQTKQLTHHSLLSIRV